MAEQSDIRTALLEALKLRYTAQLYEAKATLDVYLSNSVGVGEHPHIIEELDKQLDKYGTACDKLAAVTDLYSEDDLTLEDGEEGDD